MMYVQIFPKTSPTPKKFHLSFMQCINILMPLSNCFLFFFLVKISDHVFLEEEGQADLATDINDVSTGLSHNISHTQGASFV